MPITVDEDFINQVMTRISMIEGQIAPLSGGGIYLPGDDPTDPNFVSPSAQTLQLLSVWGGTDQFPPGFNLRNAVIVKGRETDGKLQSFRGQMHAFVSGLTRFLENTDHVESLNTVAAADLTRYMPQPETPSPTSAPETS